MKSIAFKIILTIIILYRLVQSQGQFQNFINYVNSLSTNSEKLAAVDSFMIFARSKGIPFIENNTANFIYNGAASSVCIASDFNSWSATANPMSRLVGTDFFYLSKNFEMNARLDYKFVINGSTWILDPENPKQISGGFGPNSELSMPLFIQPWEIIYNSNIPHGRVIQKNIFSTYLNATYQLHIYLPPGYDSTLRYPSVYFQDGTEYITLGSAVNVLDNLIDSNKIESLIAVFVKPNNRNEEYAFSKRNQYQLFFVNELVPFIDSLYNTIKSANKRLVIGDSYGGNISALISYNYADIFGNCGIHSGAFQPNNYETYNLIVNGEKKNIRFVSIWGNYESLFSNMRNFRDSLIEKGYEFHWAEFPEGHSWGLWRATIDIMLEKIFPTSHTNVKESESSLIFKLNQNYPNPFNSSTMIKFSLEKATNVSLTVFDLLGREITKIFKDFLEPGEYTFNFKTDSINFELSSGVFFYKLETDNFSETKKGILIK